MGLLHQRNKLRGAVLCGAYEGEGTDGGWGGWGGADPGAGTAPVERNDLAGLNAGGWTMGPPTEAQARADAAAFAGSLAGYDVTPADAVIVPLVPLTPEQIKTQPVAAVELVRQTVVDFGQALSNAANFALGLLGIGSGTPSGVIGGSRAVLGAINAPSAFSSQLVETVTLGSAAPSIARSDATGPAAAAAAFAGAVEGGQGTTAEGSVLIGSPVLDYRGALVFAGTPTGAGSVTPSLAPSTRGQGAGLRDPFTLGGSAAAQPAIPAGLVLAGLASFLMS